ncbi:MAG: hypothetical protein RLY14_298, partial [Planctomycetota bacterium]
METNQAPTDPVVKIYGDVFDLLQYLRTMESQKISIPNDYERGCEGEIRWKKPTVDRCWQEFDSHMLMYRCTVEALQPQLRRIRDLRRDTVVENAVFRTFAAKQRESTSLDDAIAFIEKGEVLFRRLFEEGGAFANRTEEDFQLQLRKCDRIWEHHAYETQDIQKLESGLKWELATILNRRSPVQSTSDQTPKQVKNTARKGSNGKVHKNRKELLISALLDHHRFNRPGSDIEL